MFGVRWTLIGKYPTFFSYFSFRSVIKDLSPLQRDKFLSSVAGSLLAGFVLGIRDRHQDNMLVKDNHVFFHIDFGHLWNQGPLVDAPRMAVPTRLKANLDQVRVIISHDVAC